MYNINTVYVQCTHYTMMIQRELGLIFGLNSTHLIKSDNQFTPSNVQNNMERK